MARIGRIVKDLTNMQILMTVDNDQSRLVLIDDEDLTICLQHKWYLNRKTGYMITGNKPCTELHKLVVGPAPDGLLTDHIDRNKLNNQKGNLRFVSPQLNGINSFSKRGQLRHIYPTRFNTWTVRLTRNYEMVILGNFKTIEEAKTVRDEYLAKEGLSNVILN